MGGQVLIVDACAGRRAALRSALALPDGEVADLADPAGLPHCMATARPDLLLLDLGAEGGLDGLRRLRAGPAAGTPTLAIVPPDRPDLRLAALDAGAEDAVERGTAPRLLQARIRSLLRQSEDALGLAPPPEGRDAPWPGFALAEGAPGSWPGLAEAPAAFAPAPGPEPSPAELLRRARVALLSACPVGTALRAEAVAGLLQAGVVTLGGPGEVGGGDGYDLVVIDGAGTQGDLVQGARVLALLADLQDRQRGRPPATLVLLPASAVETAALSLDLGASDVVVGPAAAREVLVRARALVARRRLREALRDQVRLGLQAAVTDSLTGLPNRRYAEAALRRLADGSPACALALLMIDIDHFKAINDNWGHAAGDRVLVEVARRLRRVLRPSDLLARVGGEEFLVALSDTTAERAGLVAERLRRAVNGRPCAIGLENGPLLDGMPALLPRHDGTAARAPSTGQVHATISVGVAAGEAGPGPGLAALVRRADHALYKAKAAGRNAVALADGRRPLAGPLPSAGAA